MLRLPTTSVGTEQRLRAGVHGQRHRRVAVLGIARDADANLRERVAGFTRLAQQQVAAADHRVAVDRPPDFQRERAAQHRDALRRDDIGAGQLDIVEQNRLPLVDRDDDIHHVTLAIDVDVRGRGVGPRVAAVGVERFDAAEIRLEAGAGESVLLDPGNAGTGPRHEPLTKPRRVDGGDADQRQAADSQGVFVVVLLCRKRGAAEARGHQPRDDVDNHAAQTAAPAEVVRLPVRWEDVSDASPEHVVVRDVREVVEEQPSFVLEV